MKYLNLLQYSLQEKNTVTPEIKVEKNDNYVIKVFASGIVVRYPAYSADLKCYQEIINDKKVHVVKGNNAEILVVPDENIIIIGDNNSIYCIGETESIITRGLNNIIHDIKEAFVKHYSCNKNRKSDIKIARVAKSTNNKVINISELRNIWNSTSVYFA